MEQIYDFEKQQPPVLNENILYAMEEKRRLRLQTALVAFAAIFLQLLMTIFGFLYMESIPRLSMFCFVYVLISMICNGTATVIYTRRVSL